MLAAELAEDRAMTRIRSTSTERRLDRRLPRLDAHPYGVRQAQAQAQATERGPDGDQVG